MQSASARPDQVQALPSLDNDDIDSRERQLARQHHSRRTASGDYYFMVGHSTLLLESYLRAPASRRHEPAILYSTPVRLPDPERRVPGVFLMQLQWHQGRGPRFLA